MFYREPVSLSYNAQFGPDVDDVLSWKDAAIAFVEKLQRSWAAPGLPPERCIRCLEPRRFSRKIMNLNEYLRAFFCRSGASSRRPWHPPRHLDDSGLRTRSASRRRRLVLGGAGRARRRPVKAARAVANAPKYFPGTI